MNPDGRPRPSRRFLGIVLGTALASSAAFGFRPEVHPLERGIDASYLYSATYASTHGLRFGRDFVSTFGPFCYLIYAADLGTTSARKLVSEVFLVALAGVATALYLSTGPALSLASAVVLAVLSTFAVHVQGNSIYGDEYRWFSSLLLLLLASIRAPTPTGLAGFFAAGLLGGFFLLVKLSLGFGALLSLSAGALLFRRPRVVSCAVGLLGLGALVGFSIGRLGHEGSLAGIRDFASAALPVVSGYSSAMSLSPDGWERTALSFAAFVLVTALWSILSKNAGARLSAMAFATPLFITWKHALVRHDGSHVRTFVLFGLFVVCLLMKDVVAMKWRAGAALLAMSLVPLFAPWYLQSESETESLATRLAAPLRFHHRPISGGASLENLRVPDDVRSTIDDSSIDVYPWESVYVAANDFNWHNRPSPASFATYVPALDRRNERFFSSPERPRFLLWHLQPNVYSIDGRHLFWDEPRTLRAILSSYSLAASGSVFLLETVARPRLSEPRRLAIVEAVWDTWISVPDANGALLASVDFDRPWWASVRRVLLREDPMFVSLRFDEGDVRTYRFVPDQAESGLWVSPLPRDLAELGSILNGNLSRPRPRAIRFHGAWGSPTGAPFVVTWLRMDSLRR